MCTFCSLLPIHSCELVIVLINPRGSVSRVSARNKYEVSMYALLKISIVCKWFIPKFALESFLPCWLITNWKIKFQIFYRMLNFFDLPNIVLLLYLYYFFTQISSQLSVSVVTSDSGRTLANRMVSLAVKFFNLVITSVTGIPMKVGGPLDHYYFMFLCLVSLWVWAVLLNWSDRVVMFFVVVSA